jgi:hypothetical protein
MGDRTDRGDTRMNRAQLEALHLAGLITTEQLATALAQIAQGTDPTRPQLNLELDVRDVSLAVDDAEGDAPQGAVLTATITRYDELIPSHGLILHAGSAEFRTPYERVKMLRDHNHSEPIGYMLDVDTAGEEASFRIAPTEVPRVQQEFDDKLRDGVSIGFLILDYEIDEDWILHAYRIEVYEASLVAIPAVADAGVSSVAAALATSRKENRIMNRAQLRAALTAGQITQEQHDAAIAALDAVEAAASNGQPTTPPAPEVAAGPDQLTTQPVPPVHVGAERRGLRQVTQQLITAANTGNPADFQLALADIIPDDDAAPAFLRDDWQGEAWRDDSTTRPWIDAFGAPADLTSLKGRGWEWGTADVNGDGGEPLVDEYAGNKTDIPTNEIGTAPKTYDAFRIAAGWDVDRAFVDFADSEFWGAFWPAVLRDYKRKSDAGIRTRVLAKASAPAGTVTAGGVKAVLKQLVRDVRPYGKANRMFLGADLFTELEDLSTEDLPLWLKSATIGLDIAEGSADVGTLRILLDESLAAKQGVAFDNRAGKVREKTPFRVQAENIPKGGVDVGIFAYLRFDDYDKRAIVKRTYVPA